MSSRTVDDPIAILRRIAERCKTGRPVDLDDVRLEARQRANADRAVPGQRLGHLLRIRHTCLRIHRGRAFFLRR